MQSRTRYSTNEVQYLVEMVNKHKGLYKAAVAASRKLDRNVAQLYAKLYDMRKKGLLNLAQALYGPTPALSTKPKKTYVITITIEEKWLQNVNIRLLRYVDAYCYTLLFFIME